MDLDRHDHARERILRRSLELLNEGQHDSGAFVAAPTYPTYRFGWLRDGSFCAYALDLVGERAPAAAFHRWVSEVVVRHESLVSRAIEVANDGADPQSMLPTRFTLDGALEAPGDEDWPNFQLDGYGTWLWTLSDHLNGVAPTGGTRDAVRLVTEYLMAAADLPCYDCWEEFGDGHHTSTLGSVAAGLRAAARMLGDDGAAACADRLVARIEYEHVRHGALIKQAGDERVDASTLWLALPFGLFEADGPVMRTTAARIRAELVRAGSGVVRYLGDTFYGGGAWILLTAWLGWYESTIGDHERAEARYRWIVDHAGPDGSLPEQVLTDPQAPERIAEWNERWGPVADPLLWSHAMFLVFDHHRQLAAVGRP